MTPCESFGTVLDTLKVTWDPSVVTSHHYIVIKGTVSEQMIIKYVIKGCLLMTQIYIKRSKSHYFFEKM